MSPTLINGRTGERHHASKLNETQVMFILQSDIETKALAELLDVSATTVCQIRRRHTWKHLMVVQSLWHGLVDTKTGGKPVLMMMDIIRSAGRRHDVPVETILGRCVAARTCLARDEAAWECRRQTTRSYSAIGRVMNRDHSTILFCVRRHQKRLDFQASVNQSAA